MATADEIITQALSIANTQAGNVVTYSQNAMTAADGSLSLGELSAMRDINGKLLGTTPTISYSANLTAMSSVPGSLDRHVPTPGDLSPSVPDPQAADVTAYIDPALTAANFDAGYQATRTQLIELAATNIASVLLAYFPTTTDGYDQGTNWLINTITLGGTGIPAAIEDQIWQRSRDRILVDNTRAQNSAYADFAARGFPVPSGALAAKLKELRYDGLAKISDQSRETAIKQIEIEINNIRFAVEKTLTLRHQAWEKALAYIREIMVASQAATAEESSAYNAQAALASAAASYYQSKLQRDSLLIKAAEVMRTTNLGLIAEQVRAASAEQSSQIGLINAAVQRDSVQRQTELEAQGNALKAASLDRDSGLKLDANAIQYSSVQRGTEVSQQGVAVQNFGNSINARVNASLGACKAAGDSAAASLGSINAIASTSTQA